MAKTKRTPFVVFNDGRLYIESKHCGIHHLVLMFDGISLSYEAGKKNSKTYILVQDAIDWHRKELAETNWQSGSQKFLDALTKAQSLYDSGKTIEA